jgi:hypothetical protein
MKVIKIIGNLVIFPLISWSDIVIHYQRTDSDTENYQPACFVKHIMKILIKTIITVFNVST